MERLCWKNFEDEKPEQDKECVIMDHTADIFIGCYTGDFWQCEGRSEWCGSEDRWFYVGDLHFLRVKNE